MEIDSKFAETCDYYVCHPAGELPLADNKLAECSRCGITIMHRPDGPVTPPKICMNCAVLLANCRYSQKVAVDDGHKAENERS